MGSQALPGTHHGDLELGNLAIGVELVEHQETRRRLSEMEGDEGSAPDHPGR